MGYGRNKMERDKAFIFNNVFIQQILKNNTLKAKAVNSRAF